MNMCSVQHVFYVCMYVISALFDMAWNFVYTFLIFGTVKLRVAL